MKHYGFVIGLKSEHLAEYKRLHADVWPTVLEQIRRSNIRNYSIFLREPENLLFAHYEYHGTDHDADIKAMAADPETRKWWAVCMPMQQPLETIGEGDWWAPMDHVFLMEK